MRGDPNRREGAAPTHAANRREGAAPTDLDAPCPVIVGAPPSARWGQPLFHQDSRHDGFC